MIDRSRKPAPLGCPYSGPFHGTEDGSSNFLPGAESGQPVQAAFLSRKTLDDVLGETSHTSEYLHTAGQTAAGPSTFNVLYPCKH
jgi:hypothetical protein